MQSSSTNDDTPIDTIVISVPSSGGVRFVIDRLAFDAPDLPCDLSAPDVGCGPLVVARPRSGADVAELAGPARCGNRRVEPENGEECDGGGCCTEQCKLRPSGEMCREARRGDDCDVADFCDGISGGCVNAHQPVGSPCDDERAYTGLVLFLI